MYLKAAGASVGSSYPSHRDHVRNKTVRVAYNWIALQDGVTYGRRTALLIFLDLIT